MNEPNYVKIRLPGESPWAELISEEDGTLTVRIANVVAGDYSPQDWWNLLSGVFQETKDESTDWAGRDIRPHSYKFGDTLLVRQTEYGLEPVIVN